MIFKIINKIFKILTKKQKKELLVLQILVIISSSLEVISITLIGYFMTLINDETISENNNYFYSIYQLLGTSNTTDFISLIGLLTIGVLLTSTIFSISNSWLSSLIGNKLGISLGNRLYNYYLHESWLFHTLKNSSDFTRKITHETNRTTQLFLHLIILNSKIIFTLFMAITLFIINPIITLIILISFFIIYWLIYQVINKKIKHNSKNVAKYIKIRIQLIFEGLGGIKEILLLNCQKNFIHHFNHSGNKIANANSTNQILVSIPRFLIEFMVITTIILLITYSIRSQINNFLNILPTLTIYILAGLKLLPTFQAIYASTVNVKANMVAFNILEEDLKNSFQAIKTDNSNEKGLLVLQKTIKLKNISFTYSNKSSSSTINNINLTIHANKVVGFVGASGSGKTTIIDIILGLIPPDTGQILIDDKPLNSKNLSKWQAILGCVSQRIFLSDSSIKKNIAFGVPDSNIDNEKIKKVIEWAHLNDMIATLPKGIDTKIGEQGVQLSGGQQQRIGIARALYHNAGVILLDEATSSLDGLSEKFIMDSINDFSGKKTIIIVAHRLKTVQKCEVIYMVDKGKIIGQGSYAELAKHNVIFQKMLQYA